MKQMRIYYIIFCCHKSYNFLMNGYFLIIFTIYYCNCCIYDYLLFEIYINHEAIIQFLIYGRRESRIYNSIWESHVEYSNDRMFQYCIYPIYDSHPTSNFIIFICYSLFSFLYSYRKDTQLVKRTIDTTRNLLLNLWKSFWQQRKRLYINSYYI